MICESGPDKQYGYLSTDKNYDNFILDLQFKQEADGNSGVFIRSGIEGTKISGWQVEIAPPDKHTGGIDGRYIGFFVVVEEAVQGDAGIERSPVAFFEMEGAAFF